MKDICVCALMLLALRKNKPQTRKLQNPTDLYVSQGMAIWMDEGMLVQLVLALTSHGKYQTQV